MPFRFECILPRQRHLELRRNEMPVHAVADFDRPAHFNLDRGDAVDRAIEHVIIHAMAPRRYRKVPSSRKIVRLGPFAQGVSGLARNARHPRRRLDRPGSAKSRNETPLSLRRPAIMARTLHWGGREIREDARVGVRQYRIVGHPEFTSEQILFCKCFILVMFLLVALGHRIR